VFYYTTVNWSLLLLLFGRKILEMNEESSRSSPMTIVDGTDVGRQLGHNDDVKWCHFSMAGKMRSGKCRMPLHSKYDSVISI
jgi:hypothetical protein